MAAAAAGSRSLAERYAPEWDARLRDAIALRDELGGVLPTVWNRWLSGLASDWMTSPVTEILGRRLYPRRIRGADVPHYLSFDWWDFGRQFAGSIYEKRHAHARTMLHRFACGLTDLGILDVRGEVIKSMLDGTGVRR